MDVERLAIEDVVVITPVRHGDDRGFLSETFHAGRLKEAAGIDETFVQDNHSLSVGRGIVRGLHFQTPPAAHDKGVRWDDPALGIDWPVEPKNAILSEKDRSQPGFEALPAYFTFTAQATGAFETLR